MDKTNFDIIVIGAGPAGYSAAVRASQLGAKVLLIERSAAGGTCLNRGCIPTKFLWEGLHLASKIKKASGYGITAEFKEISFRALFDKKNRNVELLSKGVKQLLESYNVNIVEGSVAFTSEKTIEVTSESGTKSNYSCDKFIIAAGSSPSLLPGYTFDHFKVIDSTDALNLQSLPQTLLVVGGGAIGVEFASIFARLGSSVTLVEKMNQLLPGEDLEIAETVKTQLIKDGVKVTTGIASFDDIAKTSEKVLIAIGRKSNASLLNLEKSGIKFSPKGIETNQFFETSQKGIYAAGDVTGKSYLAYIAQAEGISAAENAMGITNTINYSVIPKVVFSNPPAASVGTAKLGADTVTGRFTFTANSRAFIESERRGSVKVTAEKATGKIIGGAVIGACAEELITIIALAVKQEMTLESLPREIFFHPSLSEAIHCACQDAQSKCVDLPKKI